MAGKKGMQYQQKRFNNFGAGAPDALNVMDEKEAERLKNETSQIDTTKSPVAIKKRAIPFGDRILVKRRKVGEKAGTIILPEATSERETELADVIYIPDNTLADKELLKNAETIVKELTENAKTGDHEAFEALLKFTDYLKLKTLKVGDTILISRYIGMSFFENGLPDSFTILDVKDVIARVVEV